MMAVRLLWDASGFIKRYANETGQDTVDALFNLSAPMAITYLGYTEACASLRRKLNDGLLSRAAFGSARALLRQEILSDPAVDLVVTDEVDMLNAIALVDRHRLNASDAIILTAYLRYAQTTTDTCVVVAADRRLVRASIAEGLKGCNPDRLKAADVPSFLAAL